MTIPRSISTARRAAAAVVGCVAVVAFVFAEPAAASTSVSDTASWGWGSIPNIRWSYGDSFSAVFEYPTVNDSVQDGWFVRMYVRGHDYDGTQRGQTWTYQDYSHDGQAVVGAPQQFYVYPYSIHAISIQLCKAKSSGAESCRSRQYAYR